MGMLDNSTKLAIAQAVTATGDTASTNIYDSQSPDNAEIGLNEDLWVVATVATTATSSGSATVQAVLQDSADGVTFADVLSGRVAPVASLVEGAELMLAQPPVGMRRYFRVAFRVGTAALTAGAFNAFVSMDVQKNVARPSGFSVA